MWGMRLGRPACVLVLVLVPALVAPAAARAQDDDQRDDNALPVAPRVDRAPARGGLEIGFGWRSGSTTLADGVIDLGLGVDRIFPSWGSRLAVGGRLAWLSAPAAAEGEDSLNAFEIDARARVALVPWPRSDHRQLELQVSAGLRLASVGPHHPTVGFGVTASLKEMRLGVRWIGALADGAAAEHVVLGVAEWMTPAVYRSGGDHGRDMPPTLPRVGLGLHAIGAGFGAGGLGLAVPGAAIELPVYFGGPEIVALARWDLLWFPLADGHGVLAATALAGLQWFYLAGSKLGVSALVGYTTAHGETPHPAATGAVADLGVIWETRAGFHVALHARAGLEAEGEDLRVVYVSWGARQIFR
jgi:hypothetical protein